MKFKMSYGLVIAMCLTVSSAWPDSLELKNGSLIKGKFMGGTESEIRFRVGSSVQQYNVADIVSLRLDSELATSDLPARPNGSRSREEWTAEHPGGKTTEYVTLPAGTRIPVRTIDGIDSTKNRVGDRFQASLEQPLMIGGDVLVEKGADVYGRLTESKESGTFSGKSQLRLELTGIVINGQTIPVVTGEYELTGQSRGASTAKRTVGGAAVGSVIGAIAGGGKGAAIGAVAGAAAGGTVQVLTKGKEVKVPAETTLRFRLDEPLNLRASDR